MTDVLFANDSYIKSAIATCLEIRSTEKGLAAILDQTLFYPEGGGQPNDLGHIGSVAVTDVQMIDGEILHYVSEALPLNQPVTLTLDWERRFDHMQQHSGQHLLSAIAFREFGAATIGFHLSGTYTTVDLDKKLTSDELKQLEKHCMAMILAATSFSILYPTDEELDLLPLRKRPSVEDGIRVIALGEYDYSPCGGTHLKSAAEIGMLKIKKADNYKQGMRIEFVCGYRALEDYQMKTQLLSQLGQQFSAPLEELQIAIDKKMNAFADLSRQYTLMKQELLENIADQLINELEEDVLIGEAVPVVFEIFNDKTVDDLKNIAIAVTNATNKAALCLINQTESGGQLVLARSKEMKQPDCKMLFKELSDKFGLKGGGSPFLAQGGLPVDIVLEDLIDYMKQAIK